MEFGILLQGYIPGKQAYDPAAEHSGLLNEIEFIKVADRAGFKYAWVTEHHTLVEYSHMSASECLIPFALAQTNRIHIGSGIFNVNPIVNHPVRVAERVAMLDHLSKGRFEFGTGRGAGTHEVATFGLHPSETTAIWDEVIREFKKMWETTEYAFEGKYFQVPPRNVLPKPYGGGQTHPPIWLAAGNPGTWEKAGRHGIGCLGFNASSLGDPKELVQTYKAAIKRAKPVGQYINDATMMLVCAVCCEDGKKARDILRRPHGVQYALALAKFYNDTLVHLREGLDANKIRFPEMPPAWPEEAVELVIDRGAILCGDPDEVAAQIKKQQATGIDQLVLSIPLAQTLEEATKTIELIGEHVIPHVDGDPVHRTDRMRYAS